MRPSPLLSAAAAASLLAAVAGPATAATDPVPAAGAASSTITLLDVAAGGRTVSAGSLSLLSEALGAETVARILATPLTVDGTPYGQRTITPADGPTTVDGVSSGDVAPALAGLVGVTSPVLTGTADDGADGPSSRVGADSFGGVSVLGLPVALEGTLDAGSLVSRTAGATGDKTLEITDLALPSIADVLAALGLDLKALPTEVLVELFRELDLVTTAVTAADKALDDAQALLKAQTDAALAAVDAQVAAVDAATKDLAARTSVLAPLEQAVLSDSAARQAALAAVAAADATLAQRKAAADAAGSALTAAQAEVDRLAALPLVGSTVKAAAAAVLTAAQAAKTEADALLAQAQAAATSAATAVASASSAAELTQAALDAARAAVSLARSALDAAQRLLDAAQRAVTTLLKDVQPLVDALLLAATAVLDGTPLVSIDSLKVVTASKVVSAAEGGQSAEVVGGEVVGLKVLGTDVLDDVLGTSRIDVLDLAGTTLADVDALLGELTGTLSNVLSTVPGFPALRIPAPEVKLLSKQAGTGVAGGFGTATTAVRALSITLPSITLPTALALPSAANLPVFDSVLAGTRPGIAVTDALGNLVSSPVTVALGTLSEQARFRAAVAGTSTPTTGTPTTGTPTTGTPDTGVPTAGTPTTQLPRTGASSALAVLGVALMAAAVATRRRREVPAEL